MAPTQFPTTQPASNQLETQVIVLICVSAYILIFALVIIIRQCIVENYYPDYLEVKEKCLRCFCPVIDEEACWLRLNRALQPLERVCICLSCIFCCKRPSSDKSRGFCTECTIFGKAEDRNDCCDCCIGLGQACDCSVPGTTTCCDSLCGPRRRCDLADCLTCGICGTDSKECCTCPDCDCCPGVACCTCPEVTCQSPDCNEVQLCCCTISCGDKRANSQQQPPHYHYPSPDPNFPYPPQYPPNRGVPSTSQPMQYLQLPPRQDHFQSHSTSQLH